MLLAACTSSSPEKMLVEGNFTGAAGKKIMLAELPFDRPERMVIDSATLDSSGRFSLSAIQQQEGMYQLFIENGPGILLINDTNHAKNREVIKTVFAVSSNEIRIFLSTGCAPARPKINQYPFAFKLANRYHRSARIGQVHIGHGFV